MTKFKVGDRIRILDGSGIKDYVCGWAMQHDVGKIMTVTKVYDDPAGRTSILVKESCCTYDARAVELVESHLPNLVVWANGNDVFAKNPKTGKTAKATCAPSDTFDYATGAKIAIDRLFGKAPEKTEQYLNCKFTPVQSDRNFTAGKIYEVKDGQVTIKRKSMFSAVFPMMFRAKTWHELVNYFHNMNEWKYADHKLDILKIIEEE